MRDDGECCSCIIYSNGITLNVQADGTMLYHNNKSGVSRFVNAFEWLSDVSWGLSKSLSNDLRAVDDWKGIVRDWLIASRVGQGIGSCPALPRRVRFAADASGVTVYGASRTDDVDIAGNWGGYRISFRVRKSDAHGNDVWWLVTMHEVFPGTMVDIQCSMFESAFSYSSLATINIGLVSPSTLNDAGFWDALLRGELTWWTYVLCNGWYLSPIYRSGAFDKVLPEQVDESPMSRNERYQKKYSRVQERFKDMFDGMVVYAEETNVCDHGIGASLGRAGYSIVPVFRGFENSGKAKVIMAIAGETIRIPICFNGMAFDAKDYHNGLLKVGYPEGLTLGKDGDIHDCVWHSWSVGGYGLLPSDQLGEVGLGRVLAEAAQLWLASPLHRYMRAQGTSKEEEDLYGGVDLAPWRA